MSKRLIIPEEAVITVVSGSGEVTLTNFAGLITYIRVEGIANSKGRFIVVDTETASPTADIQIFKDPVDMGRKVSLEFYQQAPAIPVNGVYKFRIEDVTDDGTYTVYFVRELRERRV